MFIVDVALEHTCAEFRARAFDGQITSAERDLLIDGAILLAANVEELAQGASVGLLPRSLPMRRSSGTQWHARYA